MNKNISLLVILFQICPQLISMNPANQPPLPPSRVQPKNDQDSISKERFEELCSQMIPGFIEDLYSSGSDVNTPADFFTFANLQNEFEKNAGGNLVKFRRAQQLAKFNAKQQEEFTRLILEAYQAFLPKVNPKDNGGPDHGGVQPKHDENMISDEEFEAFSLKIIPGFIQELYDSGRAANIPGNFFTFANLQYEFSDYSEELAKFDVYQQTAFSHLVSQAYYAYIPAVNPKNNQPVDPEVLQRAVEVAAELYKENLQLQLIKAVQVAEALQVLLP